MKAIELVIKDGTAVIARTTRTWQKPPTLGDRLPLDADLAHLDDRYLSPGVVSKIVTGPEGNIEVDVEARTAVPERTTVTLNSSYIPTADRERISQAAARHPSAPLVTWDDSHEPRAVLRITHPGHHPALEQSTLEQEIRDLLTREPALV